MKAKKAKKAKAKPQNLYNKMMLGELTLADVFKLVEKETYAIEVDGYSKTSFSFEGGELCIWDDDEYSDPNIFPGSIKVKVVDGGIEFDYEGESYGLGFVRHQQIDVMEKIRP